MTSQQAQVSINGKRAIVPVFNIGPYEVIVTGRLLRKAAVRSEDFSDPDPSFNADGLIAKIRESGCGADIFSFTQRVPDTSPRYCYPLAWGNVAAVSTADYKGWWEKLSQDTRRNVRLAQKRGLVLRPATFDDDFVRGIKSIYDETPFRQGRKFWHYGKDLETVKVENGTYVARSQFIGAYYGDELAGFLKFVTVGSVASIMQILSKNAHQDKKPMNALVAKAVELACEQGLTHLLYRQYIYHRADALTEFKRRNGFEMVQIPRYFVPLTAKGKLAAKLNLHRGVREKIPEKVWGALLDMRQACADFVRRK